MAEFLSPVEFTVEISAVAPFAAGHEHGRRITFLHRGLCQSRSLLSPRQSKSIKNTSWPSAATARLPATPKTAEIAFVILDSYQEKGIGTKFIEWLATVARKNDIDTFEAYVLPENTEMMSVFQGYGFHMKQILENNVYHISFPLTRTKEVVKAKDERASQATLKSLEHILKPHSVAVIGASNRTGTIGQLVFQSMIQSGFNGVVYPINANDDAVMSVKAYRSVLSVPGDVDLAIVAVPAAQVLGVVDECGQKKVKGIIVISDGFREKDEEGAVLEREMVDMAFGYGMRIVGPNCMGLINTDPQVKLNATFALTNPAHGNISFISQSGALGLGILEYAKSMNIGFSTFVSVGNRADIASTDLLQYWEQDPATRVILLYLESFDNTGYLQPGIAENLHEKTDSGDQRGQYSRRLTRQPFPYRCDGDFRCGFGRPFQGSRYCHGRFYRRAFRFGNFTRQPTGAARQKCGNTDQWRRARYSGRRCLCA